MNPKIDIYEFMNSRFKVFVCGHFASIRGHDIWSVVGVVFPSVKLNFQSTRERKLKNDVRTECTVLRLSFFPMSMLLLSRPKKRY